MPSYSRLRILFRIFWSRFFDNDTESPGGGFHPNVHQLLGFVMAAGLFTAYFLTPIMFELSARTPGTDLDWTVRRIRMFLPAVSFALAGFAAFFQWDTLFPDRRDFLVLGPFPIAIWELFAAKVAALGCFLLLFTAALNAFPASMIVFLSLVTPSGFAGGWLVLAQTAASVCASALAIAGVGAIQALLLQVTTPHFYRRLSPWIQMFGMSAMILSLLAFPLYSRLFRPAVENRRLWLDCFPPAWFPGIYEVVSGGPVARFGWLALRVLALAMGVFLLGNLLGFRRHHRRTLEDGDHARQARRPSRGIGWLARCPRERAIHAFTGWTLARSTKHQLFLATYVSVGLAMGLLFAFTIRNGELRLSDPGVRSFAFLITFFAVSGFRAAVQFPSNLSANWLFRLTESNGAEVSRRATRLRMLSYLAPVNVLLAALDLLVRPAGTALAHALFSIVTGALLIEAIFWTFGKIPFTCSYWAGRNNLAILAVIYLYGFTAYSFQLVDLERIIEGRLSYAILFFTSAAACLVVLWRRKPPDSETRFDDYEPEIQTLDLT